MDSNIRYLFNTILEPIVLHSYHKHSNLRLNISAYPSSFVPILLGSSFSKTIGGTSITWHWWKNFLFPGRSFGSIIDSLNSARCSLLASPDSPTLSANEGVAPLKRVENVVGIFLESLTCEGQLRFSKLASISMSNLALSLWNALLTLRQFLLLACLNDNDLWPFVNATILFFTSLVHMLSRALVIMFGYRSPSRGRIVQSLEDSNFVVTVMIFSRSKTKLHTTFILKYWFIVL